LYIDISVAREINCFAEEFAPTMPCMLVVRAVILCSVCLFPPLLVAQENRQVIQDLERSVAEAEKKGDLQELANSLADVSGQYALIGKAREAIVTADRALSFAGKVEDLGFETEAYSGLAVAYGQLGETEKSEEYAKQVQIRGQRGVIAMVMTGTNPNDFKDMEELLAFEVSRGNLKGEALARFNLGNEYFLKNDLPKALAYWQPAVRLYGKLGDWLYLGNILKGIGKALDSLDSREEAAKSWRAAADIFISHESSAAALESLDNLAENYYEQGMYPETGETLDDALTLRQQAGMMADGQGELNLSINVNLRLKAMDKVRTRCQQLVQLCRDKGDDQCVKDAIRILGQLTAK
jgi:tetratricopeptide (TPR) repeat protein